MEKKQQIIWRSLSNLLFCHVSKEGAVDPAARHSTSFDVPSSRAVPAEDSSGGGVPEPSVLMAIPRIVADASQKCIC